MASNDSRLPKADEFWNYLEENRKEVSSWPTWMRGESTSCSSGKPAPLVEKPGKTSEQ